VFPDAPSYSTNYQWVRDIADLVGIPYGPGAMVNLPRHPSQLYEALFEGIVLWLVVWFILRPMLKKRFPGFLLSCYLIGYGLIRFVIEYFREPDGNLGFIISLGSVSEPTALFQSFLNISMGQIFCFLMILGGILLYTVARHRFRMSGSPAAGDGKVVRADAKRTGNGYGRQGNHTRKRGH
jgi:phosphatidylglycerol:prolipoprotein diacylglycerol transferase